VLDLTGLGLSHIGCQHILKGCMDFDDKYFPERVEQILVVNGPFYLSAVYNAVAWCAPESIKKKLKVCTYFLWIK
jgi:hypothetical protein